MNVHGQPQRSIEFDSSAQTVRIIDQTLLPHQVVWQPLRDLAEAAEAISVMRVRGAPLIGATAAFGLALALREDASDEGLERAYTTLLHTRPTAVNLRWALDRMRQVLAALPPAERVEAAWAEAVLINEEDVQTNRALGQHGAALLWALHEEKKDPQAVLNVMTHCNAGWLATVDRGTALAPIYHAFDAGLPLHVWVSETRPRGQGAALTAWELREHGVPHTLIADNAAGHLLQRGLVDAVIVGADRVTARGDVANKIGTYLKALAAQAHAVPFYVAFPTSTIDYSLTDGIGEIPIEQRSAAEVTHVIGRAADGSLQTVEIAPPGTAARNDAFDVTPAHLISALITERGVVPASVEGLYFEASASCVV